MDNMRAPWKTPQKNILHFYHKARWLNKKTQLLPAYVTLLKAESNVGVNKCRQKETENDALCIFGLLSTFDLNQLLMKKICCYSPLAQALVDLHCLDSSHSRQLPVHLPSLSCAWLVWPAFLQLRPATSARSLIGAADCTPVDQPSIRGRSLQKPGTAVFWNYPSARARYVGR